MDEIYTIPESPEYHENIRKLQDSDPASASGTFNPLLQQIVENVAAVKEQAESKQDKLTGTQGQVVGFDADGNAVAQESAGGKITCGTVELTEGSSPLETGTVYLVYE